MSQKEEDLSYNTPPTIRRNLADYLNMSFPIKEIEDGFNTLSKSPAPGVILNGFPPECITENPFFKGEEGGKEEFLNECFSSMRNGNLVQEICLPYWEDLSFLDKYIYSELYQCKWAALLLAYSRMVESYWYLMYLRSVLLGRYHEDSLTQVFMSLTPYNKTQFSIIADTVEKCTVDFNYDLHLFIRASQWFFLVRRAYRDIPGVKEVLDVHGYEILKTAVESIMFLHVAYKKFTMFSNGLKGVVQPFLQHEKNVYTMFQPFCYPVKTIVFSMFPDVSYTPFVVSWFHNHMSYMVKRVFAINVDIRENYELQKMMCVDDIMFVANIADQVKVLHPWTKIKLFASHNGAYPVKAKDEHNGIYVYFNNGKRIHLYNERAFVNAYTVRHELHSNIANEELYRFRESHLMKYHLSLADEIRKRTLKLRAETERIAIDALVELGLIPERVERPPLEPVNADSPPQ